jgi:hypothetical protein
LEKKAFDELIREKISIEFYLDEGIDLFEHSSCFKFEVIYLVDLASMSPTSSSRFMRRLIFAGRLQV